MHQKLHSIDQNHEVSCGLRLKRKLLHYVFVEDKNVCAINQNMHTLFGHYDCKPWGYLH